MMWQAWVVLIWFIVGMICMPFYNGTVRKYGTSTYVVNLFFLYCLLAIVFQG